MSIKDNGASGGPSTAQSRPRLQGKNATLLSPDRSSSQTNIPLCSHYFFPSFLSTTALEGHLSSSNWKKCGLSLSTLLQGNLSKMNYSILLERNANPEVLYFCFPFAVFPLYLVCICIARHSSLKQSLIRN